jgi:hypothetical protein
VSKRSQRQQQSLGDSIFGGLEDAPSLEESSDAIFGTGLPVTPVIKVKMVDIDSIYPDPMQPRRAIPFAIREQWHYPEQSFGDLFVMWVEHMGDDFDLDAYLLDGITDRAEVDSKDNPILPQFEPKTPAQLGFVRLIELASSILREGLTNPISISRIGRDYLIETGERRWLAYHLLNMYFMDDDEQDWSKIPARVMPERDVWRQATENSVRQDLNAVSRARQLALLIMDIFGWENFRPLEDFDHEQDFYAQVSDGNQWRIPKDKTEQLLKAMGLNNQTQLRQYRAVLRIEPRLWKLADDTDMTENAIRYHPGFDNIEPARPGRKKSPLDRAYDDSEEFQRLVMRNIEKAKGDKRLDWIEFARQQADWWNGFARKLDED